MTKTMTMVTKVLVIVMAVILFLLLITSLSFTLSARWHTKNTQHRSSSFIVEEEVKLMEPAFEEILEEEWWESLP